MRGAGSGLKFASNPLIPLVGKNRVVCRMYLQYQLLNLVWGLGGVGSYPAAPTIHFKGLDRNMLLGLKFAGST